MEAPQEAVYGSVDAALIAIQDHALQQGYSVKKVRSNKVGNKSGGEVRNVLVACVHSGKYKQKKSTFGSRNTSSVLLDCPFKVVVKRLSSTQWQVTVLCAEHNHPAAEDISVYPKARVLDAQQLATIESMVAAGARPKVILGILHDAGSKAVSRDIYNATFKIRHNNLNARTPLRVLLDILTEKKIMHFSDKDANGRLLRLFFVPEAAKSLALEFSARKVFLIDSTPKTNCFGMPLLHGVGCTATNQTYSLFYCFTPGERVEDYVWAMSKLQVLLQDLRADQPVFLTDREHALMDALATTFPSSQNLLCLWHIHKNVVANVKRYFCTQEDWTDFEKMWCAVCNSETEICFAERWQALKAAVPEPAWTYLDEAWIPYKSKFVRAFTNCIAHYGHLVTSRVEGAHAATKRWLANGSGNLHEAFKSLQLSHEHQRDKISQRISFERSHCPTSHQGQLWEEVFRKIAHFALNLALEQYNKAISGANTESEPCTNSFTSTMGIPCSHLLKCFVEQKRALQVSDFAQHWWLHQPNEHPGLISNSETHTFSDLIKTLEEKHRNMPPHQRELLSNALASFVYDADVESTMKSPSPMQILDRPSSSSTKRDLSAFDHVEDAAKKLRKCGHCKQDGHNKRSCPLIQSPMHLQNTHFETQSS